MNVIHHLLKFLSVGALAAALTLPLIATSASAQVGISIGINAGPRFAPPAPRWERRPVRPWRDAVWVDGRWDWVGARWVWVGGRWDRPPHPGVFWHRGEWVRRGDHFVWVAGHW